MPVHKVSENVVLNYTVHLPDPTKAIKSKPYVVLINGMTDASSTWSSQIPALLASAYSVLTFDNRGVGPVSSSPPGPYSADDLSCDLKHLITGIKLPRPFHLVGFSMGGMVAQSYALKWPEDLIGVIFGCTCAKAGDLTLRLVNSWERTAVQSGIEQSINDIMLRCFTVEFYQANLEKHNMDLEEAIADASSRITVEALLAQAAVVKNFDSVAEIGSLGRFTANDNSGPLLKPRVCVMVGQDDILIPVQTSRDLHRLIAGSEWVELKGGHAFMWEYPDEANNTIISFFKKAEGY